MMSTIAGLINNRSRLIVILSGIFFFAFTYIHLQNKYSESRYDDFVGRYEINPDKLDNHFLAVNFALANEFPVSGFVLDSSEYKIQTSYDKIGPFFLNIFKENGPFTTMARPPLYPLFIGMVYKLFGYKVYYNQWINIFLLSLIAGLMPVIGYKRWHKNGLAAGISGAIIFVIFGFDRLEIYGMDLQIFTMFVLFVIVSIALFLKHDDPIGAFFIFGLSLGLGLLTKPVAVLVPIIYAVYFFAKSLKLHSTGVVKRLIVMITGIALIVSPYSVFINYKQAATESQRQEWIKRVAKSMKPVLFADWKDLPECLGTEEDDCRNMTQDFVKSILITHCVSSKFILITNSNGEQVLHHNNERCLDGRPLHYEWMFVKDSYYRMHENQSFFSKITSFYKTHPSYIVGIPIARIIYGARIFPLLYWLGIALWALCVFMLRRNEIKELKKRRLVTLVISILCVLAIWFCFAPFEYASIGFYMPLFLAGLVLFKFDDEEKISIAYPIFWGSIYFLIVALFSDERFIRIIMPVTCLCLSYYGILLISELLKTGKAKSVE